MMKKRTNVFYALLVVMCLGLSACTTAGDNTAEYFSQISSKLEILTSSSSSSDSDSTADSDTTPLDAPGDFTLDEDGSYSFTGVEDADYYLIYMYDENDTESDSYAYISTNIDEDGSGTYSGSLYDFNESYAYSAYSVEVKAYPSSSDEEHGTSEAATAEFTVSGEVVDPEFSYIWSCFTDELTVNFENVSSYDSSAYPSSVTITLTNEDDSSDVVTTTVDEVTSETSTIVVSDVTLDATYDVSADATWDETYVTNASASVDLGSITLASDANAASEGYVYSSGIYSYMDYPLMAYNFNVTDGGELATYTYTETSGGYDFMTGETTEEVTTTMEVIYTATPTDTEDGDLYTFTWTAANSDGSDLSSSPMGDGGLSVATGTLHIYEDGTFLMECDAALISEGFSNSYHDASSIEGSWVDNGDGTITMAFDVSTEQDLGYKDAIPSDD